MVDVSFFTIPFGGRESMSRVRVTESRQQLAWKLKAAVMLIFQIISAILFSIPAFATENNGWGGGNNTGLTQRDWGWYSICQGYRMYFEDENGHTCSEAIDILWSDPDNLAEMGLQSEEVYIEIKNIET